MKTKVMKKINKVLALVLSLFIVITVVDSRLLFVEAGDESVEVSVNLTDSEDAFITGATVRLIQIGTDGTETEVTSWNEVDGKYSSGTIVVDTDLEYYVKVTADGYIDTDSSPKVLDSSTTPNEYSVTMMKKVDSLNVTVKDSVDPDDKLDGATVEVYTTDEPRTLIVSGTTGATGEAAFNDLNLAEGVTYNIIVSMAGYFSTEQPWSLPAGGDTGIEVALIKKEITVTVTNTDAVAPDDKLDGATVGVYTADDDTLVTGGTTDADGRVSLVSDSFIKGKEYTIKVNKDGYKEIAQDYEMNPADREISISVSTIYPITVVVKDATGAFINDATVNFTASDASVENGTYTSDGKYVSTGDIAGSTYKITVEKENYVPQEMDYTINADPSDNTVEMELEHVKLEVADADGILEISDLVLKEKVGDAFITVATPNWVKDGTTFTTYAVKTGGEYAVEVNKAGYYYYADKDTVTIENDNTHSAIQVSTKEFGSIQLTDMISGTVINLYIGSVDDSNLIESIRLSGDTYTFDNLKAGTYVITQGTYRKASITVASGAVTDLSKADLWDESELTIVTVGTSPEIKYDGNDVAGGKVNVLENSLTGSKQELMITARNNTVIVGLVYYDGVNYVNLLTGKVTDIVLSESGANAFFGDEFNSSDAQKVLYVITDKTISDANVAVQFGADPGEDTFEQSEVNIKITSAAFGNVAGGYILTQDVANNPAVNEGAGGEFTKSTVNGTFEGGIIDFLNVTPGDYDYSFSFTANVSLKNASSALDASVLSELQDKVFPTVEKTASITITEPEIRFEGNYDIQLGAGANSIPTGTQNKYIINTKTLIVSSLSGNHMYDAYKLNGSADFTSIGTDGIITLDDGTNTLRLKRSSDGLTSAEYTFIVDTELPEISEIVFDYFEDPPEDPAEDPDKTESYNYTQSATINSYGNIVISVSASDVGESITQVDTKVELVPFGSQAQGLPMLLTDGVYKYTLTGTSRRESYFIRVTDGAGNYTDSVVYTLSVDRDAPTSPGASYNGFREIEGVQYGGAGASVNVTFTDAHNNIAGVICNVPCSTSYSADGSAVTVSIGLGNGEFRGIKVSCADKAGHVSTEVVISTLVVDAVAPVVNVSLSSAAESVENGGMIFYRGAVTANVSVSDLAINASTITSTQGTKLPEQGSEVLSADGVYTYSVSASDMCGNSSTSAVSTFTIDKTAPEVTLTFDNNDLINEKYYNAARVATFVVKDVNFDPATSIITVESSGTKPAISQWTSIGNSSYQATVTFSADAEYVLKFSCTDRAGNPSNLIEEQRFIVDKTAPVIEVEYDNYDVVNGMYYDASREATITVIEHNFVSDAVAIALTASDGLSTPISGWTSNGDVHTTKVKFDRDAVHTLQIAYVDVANNAAVPYALERFTIDTTTPSLEIYGIENNSANNDVVQPGIRYSDVNLSENISIKLAKSTGEVVEYPRTETVTDDIFTILYNDFERAENIDDIYTLTVSIEDMAGNTVSDSIIFSVNRYGSNYTLVSEFEKNVLTEAKEIVVTEINVDPLEESRISYSLNGKVVDLEKGVGYTVEEVDTDKNWKKYTYTISADNFAEEGAYVLTLYSKDKATNVQDNKAKECDIEFVIDRTAPSIVVSGIKNDGRYTTDLKTISLDIQDNLGVKEVVVSIDDEVYATFTKEDLAAEYGVVSFDISESNDWQTVSVSAVDDAGNEVLSDSVRIMVTSNIFAQWVSNVPLMIGTIGGAVVVAGGGIAGTVALRKRRRIKK